MPKYMAWVKTLPCCISGMPSDDAHHIQGHGFSGSGKPSDIFVFPMTRVEHTNFHNIGYTEWEMRYGLQSTYVMKTIKEGVAHGILKLPYDSVGLIEFSAKSRCRNDPLIGEMLALEMGMRL